MFKPTNLSRPAQTAVETPYGLATLVNASKQYLADKVFGDVRKIVLSLAAQTPTGPWADLLNIVGWREPAGRIGLLDFSYEFPDPETLDDFSFSVQVREIVGGAGEPLAAEEKPIAIATFSLINIGHLQMDDFRVSQGSEDWGEWLNEACNVFRGVWDSLADQGGLGSLSYPLKREGWLRRTLQENWSAATLRQVSRNLALDLVAIDDEEQAEEHCSRTEFVSREIRLVTPELARELEAKGANAKVLGNLPLWARDNTDSPHLEKVIQDIVYEKFGQSLRTELASTEE